jgi:EamA domain-containing membrane protein RarD
VLPLFWKQRHFLLPVSIVAQRTLWSLFILLVILCHKRGAAGLLRDLGSP